MESTASKTIMYNGTEYPCEIIDTAGQVSLRAPLLVIYDKILNYLGLEEIAAIVVESKADLNMSRQVDSKDGQELAQRNKTAWIEASALRNENVAKVFELCLAEIEKGNAYGNAPPALRPRRWGCAVM
ncbi:hypothetical protein B0H13DRAFT_2325826 [Mycena leptocephala]|nr:hypothetical protein B0H13DRAFT_2325826 [Mycena leptocephala]